MFKNLTTTAKVEYNDLKAVYKVIISYSFVYKYEMTFKEPFLITKCVDQCHSNIPVRYYKI